MRTFSPSVILPCMQVLNKFLEWHGATAGGDYLLGSQYSLAEVLCTGFVQRALPALSHYRGVDVWALVRGQQLSRCVGMRSMQGGWLGCTTPPCGSCCCCC